MPPSLPEIDNPNLESQIFTHSSISTTSALSWDRLALLGDAYLGAAVSRILFDYSEVLTAGEITEIRKLYVSRENVQQWGWAYGFHTRLHLPNHMIPTLTEAIIAKFSGSAFQAYLGALAFTKGQQELEEFVSQLIAPSLEDSVKSIARPSSKSDKDAMGKLNEILFKVLGINKPEYKVTTRDIEEPGFDVQLMVKGVVLGRGSGTNTKEAQRKAAQQVLKKYEKSERFLWDLMDIDRKA